MSETGCILATTPKGSWSRTWRQFLVRLSRVWRLQEWGSGMSGISLLSTYYGVMRPFIKHRGSPLWVPPSPSLMNGLRGP